MEPLDAPSRQPPGTPPPAATPGPEAPRLAKGSSAPSKAPRKKPYSRYAKPPYTYLAMIALVIQRSPEKRLQLQQIIEEVESLFPLFSDNYKGWKDSIRHNLSSNACFQLIHRDPSKANSKRNYWSVDVGLIPPEALRLQNTPVSRQAKGRFVPDLSPYVLHGAPFPPEDLLRPQTPQRPSGASFRVDSILGTSSSDPPKRSSSLETSPSSCPSLDCGVTFLPNPAPSLPSPPQGGLLGLAAPPALASPLWTPSPPGGYVVMYPFSPWGPLPRSAMGPPLAGGVSSQVLWGSGPPTALPCTLCYPQLPWRPWAAPPSPLPPHPFPSWPSFLAASPCCVHHQTQLPPPH